MPICVFDIFKDGTAQVPKDTDLTGQGAYRWWHFDLNDPDLADWLAIRLAEIPAGALLQPETRPRCDPYEDGLILNLRGINLNEGQAADQMVSVRMWVAAGVVVTVRVRRVFALDDIRLLAVSHKAPATPAAFLIALISRLTLRVQDEVMKIAKLTDFYEQDLEDKTTGTPRELPASRRSVIKLRRYLEPQQSALRTLTQIDTPLVPKSDALTLRELANRTTIAVEELNSLRERIVTVQDEHDLHIAQKQANHGFRLSVAAGVFLPLSFLTGLFGVNVAGMPGIENPWAFTLLSLAMVAIGVAAFLALKFARWL